MGMVPGSIVATALAPKGQAGAGVQAGASGFAQTLRREQAKGRQEVSPPASRSVAQGVSRRASGSRKKGCYAGAMSVNSTHPDYDGSLPVWLRARDVIAGEDAVKSAGEKYLPRLEAQPTRNMT